MVKIGFLLVGMISLLFLVNTCAAVDFLVSPGIKYANPGDTVTYGLTVSLTDDECNLSADFFPFTEYFSIDNPISGWNYSFSRDSVMLVNDDSGRTNSSVLSITVPLDAETGTYSHSVNATGYNSLFGSEVIDQAQIYVVNTDVSSIPEFPTVALPVAAILGLVAVFGRKKE